MLPIGTKLQPKSGSIMKEAEITDIYKKTKPYIYQVELRNGLSRLRLLEETIKEYWLIEA